MSRRRGIAVLTAIACAAAALVAALSGSAAVAPAGATVEYQQQCRDPYPSKRTQSNPLMLAHAGSDPLRGAPSSSTAPEINRVGLLRVDPRPLDRRDQRLWRPLPVRRRHVRDAILAGEVVGGLVHF